MQISIFGCHVVDVSVFYIVHQMIIKTYLQSKKRYTIGIFQTLNPTMIKSYCKYFAVFALVLVFPYDVLSRYRWIGHLSACGGCIDVCKWNGIHETYDY